MSVYGVLALLLKSFHIFQILGLLSSQCVLYFLDTESSLFLKNVFDPQISISK